MYAVYVIVGYYHSGGRVILHHRFKFLFTFITLHPLVLDFFHAHVHQQSKVDACNG